MFNTLFEMYLFYDEANKIENMEIAQEKHENCVLHL